MNNDIENEIIEMMDKPSTLLIVGGSPEDARKTLQSARLMAKHFEHAIISTVPASHYTASEMIGFGESFLKVETKGLIDEIT